MNRLPFASTRLTATLASLTFSPAAALSTDTPSAGFTVTVVALEAEPVDELLLSEEESDDPVESDEPEADEPPKLEPVLKIPATGNLTEALNAFLDAVI